MWISYRNYWGWRIDSDCPVRMVWGGCAAFCGQMVSMRVGVRWCLTSGEWLVARARGFCYMCICEGSCYCRAK